MAELLCYSPANITESTHKTSCITTLQKSADSEDCSQMKLVVLSAVHFIAEAWRLITHNKIKNCFVKCDFSIDHISNTDDSAVKLNEDGTVTLRGMRNINHKKTSVRVACVPPRIQTKHLPNTIQGHTSGPTCLVRRLPIYLGHESIIQNTYIPIKFV
jgi:hypothetical protein